MDSKRQGVNLTHVSLALEQTVSHFAISQHLVYMICSLTAFKFKTRVRDSDYTKRTCV